MEAEARAGKEREEEGNPITTTILVKVREERATMMTAKEEREEANLDRVPRKAAAKERVAREKEKAAKVRSVLEATRPYPVP